jgi:hypothetical protein
VVSQTEWDTARTALLERERTVAAAMDELAAARKRMPMVRVQHDYHFEGPDGRRSLPELFDGRGQLILYRFFFEEGVGGWPDAGCVGCSSVADGIPNLGLPHACGGQSDVVDVPEGWPQAPNSFWYRRHDEFDDPPPSASGRADADDRR